MEGRERAAPTVFFFLFLSPQDRRSSQHAMRTRDDVVGDAFGDRVAGQFVFSFVFFLRFF